MTYLQLDDPKKSSEKVPVGCPLNVMNPIESYESFVLRLRLASCKLTNLTSSMWSLPTMNVDDVPMISPWVFHM
jgi:hypothetical protein